MSWGQELWIALRADAQYRIIDDGKSQPLTIHVTLGDIEPSTVQLEVTDVQLDSVQRADLVDAFTVQSPLNGDKGSAQRIMLTVDTKRASWAGTYEVWIDASTSSPVTASENPGDVAANAPGRTEKLKVSIVHPPAALRVPENVPIEVVHWPFWVCASATPLKLELTSKESRLSGAMLGSIRYRSSKSVEGKITLAQTLSELAAKSAEEFPWNVAGSFPLGTIEADTEIRGDQLTNGVGFKITVKSRRTLLWLFVATVLGLAASWYLKIRLASDLQLRSAQLEGLRVLDAIDSQIARYPDPDFAAALTTTRADLAVAINRGTAEDLRGLATAAKAALSKEVEKLDQDRRTIKAKTDEWLDAVDVERDGLPDGIKRIVARATSQLRDADAAIAASTAQATIELTKAREAMVNELQAAAERWRRALADAVQALKDPQQIDLPSEVGTQISADAERVAKLLEPLDLKLADAKSVAALLDQIGLVRLQASIAVQSARDRLLAVVNELLQELNPVLPAGSQEPEVLRAAAAAAIERLSREPVEEQLRALAQGASEEIQNLESKIGELLKPLRVGEPQQQQEIDQLIDARRYVAAARLHVRAKKSQDAKLSVDAQPPTAAAGPAETPMAAPQGTAQVVAMPRRLDAERKLLHPVLAPADVPVSMARKVKEIASIEFRQTVVAGGIFLLVAYSSYADTYVGTFKELVAIFFAALTVDVTLGKVLEAAAKK